MTKFDEIERPASEVASFAVFAELSSGDLSATSGASGGSDRRRLGSGRSSSRFIARTKAL